MNRETLVRPTVESAKTERQAAIFCPICTHTVPGVAYVLDRRLRAKPGQHCARCHSSLDPGVVVRLLDNAA